MQSVDAIKSIDALPPVNRTDYPDWGSPNLGQELDLLKKLGAKKINSGYIYPDGSFLFGEWVKDSKPVEGTTFRPDRFWVWYAAAKAPEPGVVPPNNFGLTRILFSGDFDPYLCEELGKNNIAYSIKNCIAS